jgi:hypothetical protein
MSATEEHLPADDQIGFSRGRVPSLRAVIGATIVLSLLASCADASQPAGSSDRPNDVPEGQGGFQAENSEAILLGSLDHLVTGRVVALEPIPESHGRSAMTLTVEHVDWNTDWRWYFGERQSVVALRPGDKLRVAVDDEWSLEEGARATVGVSTIPFGDVEGYVHVALGVDVLTTTAERTEGVDGDLGARSMQEFVQTAAQIRGVSLDAKADREPQTALVVELIEASRRWLDEQNLAVDQTAQAPRPGGLVAEVNQAMGRNVDVSGS